MKDRLSRLFTATISYLAIILNFISMFELQQVSFYALIPGLLLFVLLFFYHSLKARFFIFAILILSMLSFFFFQKENILNGLFLTINQIADIVGRETGFILTQYEIMINNSLFPLAVSSFWIYISIFLAILCYFTLEYKRNILLWVIIIPLLLVQLITDIMPGIYYDLLLLLSAVLLMSDLFTQGIRNKENFRSRKTGNFLSGSLIIILLFFGVFIIMNAVLPVTSYSKPEVVKDIERILVNGTANFRYEKNKTNTFTQGDFSAIGDLELLEEEALEVIMDNPTSLYLRGFVGSEYTSERWEELDPEVQYDSHDLLYWLNYEGFHPLNQLSYASEINEAQANEMIDITINNLNANSNYIYTPYELHTPADEITHAGPADGSMLKGDAFFGERFYQFEASKGLVRQYPALANQIYQSKENSESGEYLNQESHYNAFVYENYTAIPEQVAVLLENHLAVTVEGEGQHVSYEEAIDFVKGYLYQTVDYTIQAEPVPKGNDFLTHLFEHTQSGYATHFATAGTMIFRYLGIPSRYVEGYLITPEDIEGKMEYEKITIEGTNAHAWPEIYLDEVGWIPIEVTPPYYDVMEPTDLTDYPTGDVELNQTEQTASNENVGSRETSQEVTEQEQPQSLNEQKPEEEMGWLMRLVIVFLVIIVLFIIAYILFVMIKRKKLAAMKRTFEDTDYKIAVPKLFSYTMKLLHYDGLEKHGGSAYSYANELEQRYSSVYANKYKTIVSINQEARFSQNAIADEQYREMYQFMKETLKMILAKKAGWQRLKMKFIDFIY